MMAVEAPEAPALAAYRIRLPGGRTKVAGKLIRVGRDLVFYRANPLPTAELKKWHALSFDARILSHLKAAGVAYIDHRSRDDLYRISLADFEANAVEATHRQNEGPQHYVDRDLWRLITPAPYRSGYTTREQLITRAYVEAPAPTLRPEPKIDPQGRLSL